MFGETLKAAVALKSRIGERVGLCLEDQSPLDAQPGAQVPSAGECQPGVLRASWGHCAGNATLPLPCHSGA